LGQFRAATGIAFASSVNLSIRRRIAMSALTHEEKQQLLMRAGVFNSLREARNAVTHLQAAGFSNEQITVICSDENKERYLREFEHQEPAGSNTPAVAATGSAIGATVGGLAAGVAGIAAGGLPLVVAGGIGAMAGAVWGGFLGAMMTRGIERESANFYTTRPSKKASY
jgi:hypothetical protein